MNTERAMIVAAALLAAAPGLATAQIMSVAEASGQVAAVRGGEPVALSPGAPVIARDTVRTGPDSRVTLRLAGQGQLELGPASELYVEQLPYATFAPSLDSSVQLRSGTLRVDWHPSPPWALTVRVAEGRQVLSAGEFSFAADASQAASAPEADWSAPYEAAARTAPGAAETAEPPAEMMDPGETPEPWEPAPQAAPAAPPAPEMVRSTALNRYVRVERPQPTGTPDRGPGPDRLSERAPPAAPRPVALTPPATPATGTGWSVNVASVARRDGAEQMAQRLEQAGYRAVIVMTEVDGRITHRVQVPGYESEAAAQAAARALAAEFAITDTWVVRTP